MADILDRTKAALADRYRIERELGSGGMTTVCLAEVQKHHRKVAAKVLRLELAAALGPERFPREIEGAAQLHHPHILPLYDSGEAEGTPMSTQWWTETSSPQPSAACSFPHTPMAAGMSLPRILP